MSISELAAALSHERGVQVWMPEADAPHMGVHGPEVDLERFCHIAKADRIVRKADEAECDASLTPGQLGSEMIL